MLLLRIVVFLLGAALSLWTVLSALRSFVLPRADRAFLTYLTFQSVYNLLRKILPHRASFDQRDRLLAMLSPLGLFALPLVWLGLIIIGYTAIYWAIEPTLGLRAAVILSGSSLMTLGFAYQDTLVIVLLAFSQAALSMMLIALLIGYLPTMYGAFSERETQVTKLEMYAGTPPRPVEMLRRMQHMEMLTQPDLMREFWMEWVDWFVRLDEIHTTLAPMNFFRSSKPDRHWVTAAGAVLDCAAIVASSVQIPRATVAGAALRSGYLSLRSIADIFGLEYNHDPDHTDPIAVSRAEFEAALDELAGYGIPLHPDRDQCWEHFCGWRVNYGEVLIGLARITAAPYAQWSSDRAREWRAEDIPANAPSILDGIRAIQEPGGAD